MKRENLNHIINDFFDGITPKKYSNYIRYWLMKDIQVEEKEEAMLQIWNNLHEEDMNVQDALQRFQANRNEYESRIRQRNKRKKILQWAAILILPIISAVLPWLYAEKFFEQKQLVEFYVPEGKIDSLILSDGTKVILNSNSNILYPSSFNAHSGNRDVYLLGEAYFSVAKDTRHPFIVHSGKLNIQVLGTEFSVKAYPNEEQITTTLVKGSVKLYDESHNEMMSPNEQIVYNRGNGQLLKQSVLASECNYWMLHNLSFNNQPLGKILQEIEKQYKVKFDIGRSVETNQRFTMNFTNRETIIDVMKVITKLKNNLEYYKDGQTIKLIQSRKEDTH